jgi:Co/Zn/Cd efflux system component
VAGCAHDVQFDGASAAYKRVLWVVIAINGLMFFVEMTAGLAGQSMALKADALDFLGDTLTYALSLAVIGQSVRWRASAALFKGFSLAVLGLWVLGATLYRVVVTGHPDEIVMGGVGMLAFAANVASVLLLLRYRDGDANVRSVWLCSRNDAIGNVAVMLAAGGVFATGTAWPDLLVAGVMASLFLYSALRIVRQARAELAHDRAHNHTHSPAAPHGAE